MLTRDMHTGFVYIWYDMKMKWFYIGSHMGTLDDGYIGSNIRLQRAYKKRPETFRRRVLAFYYEDDTRGLHELEQKYLSMIKHEELHLKENLTNNTTRYYNIKPNAAGLSGRVASQLKKEWWDSQESENWRSELSRRFSKNNPSKPGNVPWNKGIKAPQISVAKKGKPSPRNSEEHAKVTKEAWERGCYDNRPKELSQDHRQKISNSLKALNRTQTDYQRQRASEANKGVPKSEEHRRKISENAKARSQIVETCFVCGFVGSGPSMRRWHMTNCRH